MATAIDTETTLVTNDEPVPQLVSIAVHDSSGRALLAAHDPAAPGVVAVALEAGAIFANAPFDITVLLRAFPELFPAIVGAYEGDRIFDVLTRERLIDIALGQFRRVGGYGLGAVAHRRAGIELDKDDPWRLRYRELLGQEITQWPAAARHYAEMDPYATYETWAAQERFAAEHCPSLFDDGGRQARGHLPLYWQSILGINTDAEHVEALDRKLWREISELSIKLLDCGLMRVQGTKAKPKLVRNMKAAQSMLLATGAPVTKTKTGISVSEAAIKDADVPTDHPLRWYQRVGSLQALRTKNIPVMRAPIVRTRYHELMETGRTSSAKPPAGFGWVGTNLQNLPRKGGFRECLVPPDDRVWVISDWSGAELVTLAQVQIDLFGTSALGDAMRDGRDPHAELGCAIAGIDYATFDKSIKSHADARQLAKVPNFGYPGGMGPRKLVAWALKTYDVRLTEERARELKTLWRNKWPEMRPYHDWIASQADVFGRYRIVQPRSGRIRGGCTFTEACNTCFQGLAADAAKTALWDLWLAGFDPASPLFGCTQRLFAHDENVTAAPIDRAEAARDEQERIMINAFAQWCPDVPIKVESSIVERYKK